VLRDAYRRGEGAPAASWGWSRAESPIGNDRGPRSLRRRFPVFDTSTVGRTTRPSGWADPKRHTGTATPT